jgi:hypothetical protein
MNALTEIHPLKTRADSACDLTDVWMEETDPQNERGEACEAYFTHDGRGDAFTAATLIGARIDTGHRAYELGRDEVLAMVGADEVARVEALHLETQSEQEARDMAPCYRE